MGDTDPAAKFAPRLVALHAALDVAVLAAYVWADLFTGLRIEAGDEEMLLLLALNGTRASIGGGPAVAAVAEDGGKSDKASGEV